MCSKKVDIERNRHRDNIHQVETIEAREYFISQSRLRNDEWGNTVLTRLLSCFDLVAEEAVYHSSCRLSYNKRANETGRKGGRPISQLKNDAFEKLCEWFEFEGNLDVYSLPELYAKMGEDSTDIYSMKSFREKLKTRYNDHVYFVDASGSNPEMIGFKNISDFILRNMKESQKRVQIS